MSGPWDDPTPKTRYQMLWGGQWRPVMSMYDAGNVPTTVPGRAAKAVLYAETASGEGQMVVVGTGPADIMARPGHICQTWEAVH